MKIALVSQEYPPETGRGGIGSQTLSKAHGLVSMGHSVFVISRSTDGSRHEIRQGDLTIIRVPGLDDVLPEMTDVVHWITHSVVVAAELESLHVRVGLDMIDFPEWAAEGYTYLLNRTPWKSVPVVIHLHGPLVMFGEAMGWPDKQSDFYKIGTHMEATCVQLADSVYSSSACSAKWVRDYYHPGAENIPVIHLGVDTKQFAPRPTPRNIRPTIVFAGKMVANKGVAELVEAASNLVSEFPGLQLRMIGQGSPNVISHLKELAHSSGAYDLLDFAGYVHKEDLPDEFSKAHVFAAPSHYEGGPGFVYLEAMSCGLSVVGCSGSGVDEIVISGENGILVQPKDVLALEDALRSLLRDRALADKMGSRARAFVLDEADSERCLENLESFYVSVLEKSSAGVGE